MGGHPGFAVDHRSEISSDSSSFGSGEKAFAVSQTITVTDTRISVTSISHVTQWDSGNSFVGYYAASKEVRLKVVFSDGTMFEDILDSDIPVSTLVEITSSQDDAIKAVASFVELKANYYKAVTLTASSICSATLNTNKEHPTITGTDEVYANLLADKNDVDIGANNGIPLPPKSAGELFEVAVRINTDDEILVGAQLSVNFDDTYIKAVSAIVGSDWPSYFQETINYPSTSASILISNAESTV